MDEKELSNNSQLEEEEEARIQFEAWKEQYWNLYMTEVGGVDFLFREISLREYRIARRLYDEDQTSLEEYICKKCVLEPDDFNFTDCIAGIPTTLANLILYESGFVEDTGKLDGYIEKYREEMNLVNNQIICAIKEAFPELSIEEIENWPMQKTVWYFSRAEYILYTLRGMPRPVEQPQQKPHPKPVPKVREQVETQVEEPVEKTTNEPANGQKGKFEFTEMSGNTKDFPEVAEIKAFMSGKWNPPPIAEGEDLLY